MGSGRDSFLGRDVRLGRETETVSGETACFTASNTDHRAGTDGMGHSGGKQESAAF